MILNVCKNLGDVTNTSTNFWRIIFILSLILFGAGIVPYLILYVVFSIINKTEK
jgi:phage shock protein PspC (stress-responsive transcriptional regulator)